MIIKSPTISSSYISSSLAAVYRTQPHRSYVTARNSGRLNYHKENLRKLTLPTTRGSLVFH